MRLDAEVERDSLVALGAEAVGLLCRGDIKTLAQRYGYALSHGREPATAIGDDLKRCLSQVGAAALAPAPEHPVRAVKFFEPNSSNLVAVVECLVPTGNSAMLLVELIVSSKGAEKHITLEDITVEDAGVT